MIQTSELAKEWADNSNAEPSEISGEVFDAVGSQEISWKEALLQGVVTSDELQSIQLRERKPILGDWLCEGDLGFIFAPRGVGKTWMALAMARALSEGGALGEWSAPNPIKVLYVDGEMPAALIRERDKGLTREAGTMEFLNHEILFDRTQMVINIAQVEVQQAITDYCVTNQVKVLVLDNLSTLASGMKESDNDAWELVNNWLLDFRRRGIAVVLVHHAGRNGEMRGASRREDAAFWIIALDDAKKDADDKRGARFISRFTKPSRNTQEEICAFEWHVLTDDETGTVTIEHSRANSHDVFRKLIDDGVTECSDIADEMKVSRGKVSKMAAKAFAEGWLRKEGRSYALVE